MRLRPLEAKDAGGMLEWMHDASINALFATNFAAFTEDKVRAFIRQADAAGDHLHRACVDDTDDYLGTISLKNIDMKAKNAEYAISFRARAHGTGAAAFATREILRLAFREMGLQRVYLNVLKDNTRANAFYRKMGFTYEGAFRKHILVEGQLRDLCWYSMLREEYAEA